MNYIDNRNDFKLIGKNKINSKDRAPTISFTSKNKSSKEIANFLVEHNIATRNDNFYAWRCLEALGINTEDGVVRLSMTHYNNINDTDKIIETLKKIN